MKTLFMELKQNNFIKMYEDVLAFVLSTDTNVDNSDWVGKQEYLNNRLFDIEGQSKI